MKKTKVTALFSTMLIALSAMVPVAYGAKELLNENFEAYAADARLHGKKPEDGNRAGWVVQFDQGDQQGVQVVEGSSTGGSGANERVARLFRKDESSANIPTMRRNFDPQRGEVQSSFKIRIDDDSAGTHQVVLGSIVPNEIGAAARFRFGPGAFGVLGRRDQAGGAQGPIETLIRNVKVGDWYEVIIAADPAAKTFWVSVTNLDSDEAGQSAVSNTHYFWSDISVLNRWSAEQASNSVMAVSFDDIVVSTVPGS